MKNIKTIFLSSFLTLLIVSVIFAYFYYQRQNEINLSRDNVGADFNQSSKVEETSILPVELKTQTNNSISNSRHNIITHTVKKVSSAIVGINITETKYYRQPFNFFYDRIYEREIPGLGSGAIISSDGYVITNDHVAGNANEIIVTMTDGTEYEAELIGTDKSSDIALLKIEATNLPYIKFGDSDGILIGEWAIALGNPFGLFELNDKPTVTVGVISAVGMNLGVIKERYYVNMIQTDASINGGNSGGPLVNGIGDMIGMNTIILQENKGGSLGVGFAIPINTVKKIIDELKTNGTVNRDFWTGISIHSIDKGIAKYYDLKNTNGVIITKVAKNSPASKADLAAGDVILEINNLKIYNEDTIVYILHQARTNDNLQLKILRDNKLITKTLKLESKI